METMNVVTAKENRTSVGPCLTECQPAVDGCAADGQHPHRHVHVGRRGGGEGDLVEGPLPPDLIHASQRAQRVRHVVGSVGKGGEGSGYHLLAHQVARRKRLPVVTYHRYGIATPCARNRDTGRLIEAESEGVEGGADHQGDGLETDRQRDGKPSLLRALEDSYRALTQLPIPPSAWSPDTRVLCYRTASLPCEQSMRPCVF